VIICVFSDAPSQVAQEVHPCLVERSLGLNCDRHNQLGLAEYSILLVFLSQTPGAAAETAVSAAAPGVWDVAGTYDDALTFRLPSRPHVTHFPDL